MIFRYEQYRKLMQEMCKLGRFELFRNWKGDKVYLLRHDVDFDIKLAHNLAVIENEMGITSTYFILTTCETYNIFSPNNKKYLRDIAGMGHEVGLHFDPTQYSEELEKYVKKEIEFLSDASQYEVKSISLHNPSVHGFYPIFEGYVNAYDPHVFSDSNYISDSRFLFRGKDIFEFIRNIDKSMLQILLHPMHYSETGDGYDKIVVDHIVRYMKEIHNTFGVNSTYIEQVGDDIITKFRNMMQ
ncbi:MAG: hypothetical protein ACM3SM_02905 [Bacteroidota bacterium]